jgi:hypothetical protein
MDGRPGQGRIEPSGCGSLPSGSGAAAAALVTAIKGGRGKPSGWLFKAYFNDCNTCIPHTSATVCVKGRTSTEPYAGVPPNRRGSSVPDRLDASIRIHLQPARHFHLQKAHLVRSGTGTRAWARSMQLPSPPYSGRVLMRAAASALAGGRDAAAYGPLCGRNAVRIAGQS